MGGGDSDHQAEWHQVMTRKQVANSPAATVADKQAYADAVAAFVAKHPEHGRAREVAGRIQIEFADELAAVGRYQEAIRVYRAVLSHDPANQSATRGLNDAVAHLTVTPEKLRGLERGMSRREVSQLLGRPLPGWKQVTERDSGIIEAWYYRTAAGGVAGIYFRDGKLFAAEENSQQQTGRWKS